MNVLVEPWESVDVLIIGAGLAGLSAACAASLAGRSVAILGKDGAASPGVLGFNAPVAANDNAGIFYNDTIKGGWGIGDPVLARILAEGAASVVPRLEDLGLEFDHNSPDKNDYQLLQPLGCSVPRLVHQANETGQISLARLTAFLANRGIRIRQHLMAAGLLKYGESAVGAMVLAVDAPRILVIQAKAIILATGGGHFAQGSTYPPGLTGDGCALAYRAGAELLDLEFGQFEPCRCIFPAPLGLSTTLLAKGGILRNVLGKRFVLDSFTVEGAAPKDLLARLIAGEIRAGRGTPHGGIWLDLTGLPAGEIRIRHALYDQRFREAGIDLTREAVEVAPAAHTLLGGVRIGSYCQTGVTGLFAAGEVTGGLHGANRLGGSAGTEAYVFGTLAGENAARYAAGMSAGRTADARGFTAQATAATAHLTAAISGIGGSGAIGQPACAGRSEGCTVADIRVRGQSIMATCMGPIREQNELRAGLRELNSLAAALDSCAASSYPEFLDQLETTNLLLISRLACQAALLRKESRGVHSRVDYPLPDDTGWRKNICFTQNQGVSLREPGQAGRTGIAFEGKE